MQNPAMIIDISKVRSHSFFLVNMQFPIRVSKGRPLAEMFLADDKVLSLFPQLSLPSTKTLYVFTSKHLSSFHLSIIFLPLILDTLPPTASTAALHPLLLWSPHLQYLLYCILYHLLKMQIWLCHISATRSCRKVKGI